jgi:mannose-6-phosphate isomerase-like protein (cupin superfamily)
MTISVVRRKDLPWSRIAHEFVGDDHGGVPFTFLLVDAEPGRGPSLHMHPYDEVLVVLEGEATVHDGESHVLVSAGDIVVIPAGQPHGFVNSGDGRLWQIDIHASGHFVTDWLDAAPE